jgi:hypothetical protein
MYKLILYILICALCMMLMALQTDEEIAMHTLFRAKHALNTAVHAAAQQTDKEKLARGIVGLDQTTARDAALRYLRRNLALDDRNQPLPGTFLRSPVTILALDVIDETNRFPFRYDNAQYGYSVTLRKPGVVMIIRLNFPRTYNVLGPVDWEIKGVAELIY